MRENAWTGFEPDKTSDHLCNTGKELYWLSYQVNCDLQARGEKNNDPRITGRPIYELGHALGVYVIHVRHAYYISIPFLYSNNTFSIPIIHSIPFLSIFFSPAQKGNVRHVVTAWKCNPGPALLPL